MITYDIHISDVGAFDQCRRAWRYSSPLRLNLAPIRKHTALFIGSAVHHCLEHLYKAQEPFTASLGAFEAKELANLKASPLWGSYEAQVEQDRAFILGLLEHYAAWQKFDQTTLADRNFEFIAPEQKFSVLLLKDSRKRINLAGKFDGVVRHKPSGLYYLWEIKTTRSIPERIKMLDYDQQTKAYMLAAQQATGLPIRGIIYTLLRKKLPKTPQPLKNGDRLSKAIKEGEGYNTTAHWYLNALAAFHRGSPDRKALISEEYGETIQELITGGNNFQARIPVTPSQGELDRFRAELIIKAKAMVSPLTPVYASAGYHCNYCRFRAPCLAFNREGIGAEQIQIANGFDRNTWLEESEE